MKPYGQKPASKVCECIQCGTNKKKNCKKRERRNTKKQIKESSDETR